MTLSFAMTRGLIVAAMLGLLGLAAFGFLAQEKSVKGLQQANQETLYWSAAQVELELGRFLGAVGAFGLGAENVTRAVVKERFDILKSRAMSLRRGQLGRRLSAYDTTEVAEKLVGLLEKYEATVMSLARTDTAEQRRLLSDFAGLAADLRDFALRVHREQEASLAAVRDGIRDSARLTWMLSAAALVFATLLVIVMLVETRRSRRMARESAELAERAENASRAKSRFLTMMSHELRTPMHGILGVLALVRQSGLNERQLRLVDQAERSGRQMIGLLGDILDFSDLQSQSLEVSDEVFETEDLAQGVRDVLDPLRSREGIAATVEIVPGTPRFIAGDLPRLRQALAHLVTYMVEAVASQALTVRIGYSDAMLTVRLDVALDGRSRAGWQPESMFGRDATNRGEFDTDSLGPMIARGLITLMRGRIDLGRPAPDAALIEVKVPCRSVAQETACARVVAQSKTISGLAEAIVASLGWAVWEPGRAEERVALALVETSDADEPALAAQLRLAHPAARLVALGEPESPDLFDAVCPLPPTRERIATLISPAPARRGAVG